MRGKIAELRAWVAEMRADGRWLGAAGVHAGP
ncbi:hypothetical protein PR003_g28066 [Phytophthora rubi]|uniref:Uncharacterized protein n=1 Tax=Phytophthora rubi TaxID=129364 RepID=A0A6A4BYR1_9STRA|nr:hypothetical protein PR003_g28066 [Phytophthora rubi]